ncbi:MAG: peptidylprolyl isomerase [Planctomycetaceae bacterium]
MNLRLFTGAAVLFAAVAQDLADAGERPPLVTVNGRAITDADVDAMMRSRQVPEKLRPVVRKAFVERLIDDHLLRAFLDSRKVTAPKVLIDREVSRIFKQIRKQGGKPADVLKQRGLDDAKLRKELSLPVAWNVYARRIVSDREIKQRFRSRRAEFDGTWIRARQIVLKLPGDAAGKRKALQRLEKLRSDIAAGNISFADAAKKHSTSPTAKNGGDLGFFPYRGKMPRAIARVAFRLKDKQISKPFVTPFGVHLVQVTERKPGQLSLEDARPEMFRQIARERRRETVLRLRKSAKIVRSGE